MFTRTNLAALAALSALGIAVGAPSAYAEHVSTKADVISIKVEYADLDLSSQAGAKVLLQRIHHAAEYICGDPGRDLGLARQYRSCIDTTVGAAVPKANSPVLTALSSGYAGRSGIVGASDR